MRLLFNRLRGRPEISDMRGEPVAFRSARRLVLVLLGLLLVLAGCTGVAGRNERLAREDLQAAENAYRPRGERPALPNLTAQTGLSDLIRYALLNNPKVESAFHDWKAAVEAITAARSLPDPMLTLSAEIANGVQALTPALMTDPMSSWPGPGKIPLRAEAAYQEALKKRAAFEGELLMTAMAVKRAYYQTWVVREQVRLTRESLTVVEEAEGLSRERLAAGLVTQQDVLRSQMERDRLRSDLAGLEDSRGPIAARLRAALGISADQEMPEVSPALEPGRPDLTEQSLLAAAFERNPRLKEMRGEVSQAVALYQLARKNTVPDYSFGLGANVMMSPIPVMPSAGVTLPIWRDKIAAEIAGAAAQTQSAKAKLSAEELDLAVRFAETAFAWRQADRQVKLLGERLIPKAKAALDSARSGYAAGMSSFLDLLEGQRTILDYQLGYASAAGEREMVLAEMSLVILGRWPEDVTSFVPPSPVGKAPSRSGPSVDTRR